MLWGKLIICMICFLYVCAMWKHWRVELWETGAHIPLVCRIKSQKKLTNVTFHTWVVPLCDYHRVGFAGWFIAIVWQLNGGHIMRWELISNCKCGSIHTVSGLRWFFSRSFSLCLYSTRLCQLPSMGLVKSSITHKRSFIKADRHGSRLQKLITFHWCFMRQSR